MRRALLAILPWALGAFFILGSIINGTASPAIRQDFVSWGYPEWFPYVTAVLELATAAMLIVTRLRVLGAALGAAVMSAAAFTLIRHGEYQHALAPTIVLSLCLMVGTVAVAGRRSRREARKIDHPSCTPWESDGT